MEQLLKDIDAAGAADRVAANQSGDMYDSAEPLTTEGGDESVKAELRCGWLPSTAPSGVSRTAHTDSQFAADNPSLTTASKPTRLPS